MRKQQLRSRDWWPLNAPWNGSTGVSLLAPKQRGALRRRSGNRDLSPI